MNRIARIVEWGFGIVVLLVGVVCLVCDNRVYYMCQNNALIPNIISFALVAGMVGLWYFHGKKLCALHSEQKVRRVLLVASLVLFGFEVFYAYQIYFKTGWDCKEIVDMATDIAMRDAKIRDDHYYSLYPNNVYLTAIFAFFLKIGMLLRMKAPYFLLIEVGCFMVSFSGFLMGLCVYHLTKRSHITYFAWSVYAILCGLSPWVSIPYSDTYSIIFPIAIIWLYITKERRNKALAWFLMTFGAVIGYFIKPTVIICYMAVVAWQVIEFLFMQKKPWKKSILSIASALLAVAVAFSLRYVAYRELSFTPNEAKSMTIMHYLNMGANKESGGVYNQMDVNISASYATQEERNEKNLESAIDRYKEMGLPGIFIFETQKCLTNFNDGTFAWGNEGDFYWAHVPRTNDTAKFLRSFVYHDGKFYHIYVAVMQILWFSMLWIASFNLIKDAMYRKTRTFSDTNHIPVLLAVLGIMIFLMIFEARARYMFLYSPLCFMCGAKGISKFLEKKVSNEANHN